jgi:4-amino-4-deoxy-L-arabinose transferase-like glycosyltransferase
MILAPPPAAGPPRAEELPAPMIENSSAVRRSGAGVAPGPPAPAPAAGAPPAPAAAARLHRAVLAVALLAGAALRLWQLNAYGFNTDEAVYAGQAAGLVQDPNLAAFFPVFRAHPMLFQFIVSLGFLFGVNDVIGRVFSVIVGLATVYLVYRLGALLYSPRAGAVAALLLALMPYHVVVTRQLILDGPMTFCSTLALYLVARYAATARARWLYAAGAALGITFLTKETGTIVVVAVYAFLALSPEIRVRARDAILMLAAMVAVMASYPVTLVFGGGAKTAQSYLVWQLFRRPNHDWDFYPLQSFPAMGLLVLLAAGLGLALLWRQRTWRERLLIAWFLVPVIFFQIWPTKGFQYLMPVAPVVAILAARMLTGWRRPAGAPEPSGARWARAAAVSVVALSLLVASWADIQPSTSGQFLAGTGGVPGGREAGLWIRAHVPAGAQLLTVGPSMANVLQFYGYRKAFGLSVSPNPLHRNPSYEPVLNADAGIRQGEFQYLVWDSFSADRTPFFSQSLLGYVARFHGQLVHMESVPVSGREGAAATAPVIMIYEVHP